MTSNLLSFVYMRDINKHSPFTSSCMTGSQHLSLVNKGKLMDCCHLSLFWGGGREGDDFLAVATTCSFSPAAGRGGRGLRCSFNMPHGFLLSIIWSHFTDSIDFWLISNYYASNSIFSSIFCMHSDLH